MDLRYGFNDLKRHKVVNLALGVVLLLSAFLMATGALVIERVAGSVDELFEQASPPHFLQMHAGEYDTAALEEFARAHPEIAAWQIHQMVGYDGAALSWSRPGTSQGGDFGVSLTDNLFVTQNPDFDFLLDSQSRAPEPAEGEVYVPVGYQDRFGLQRGDQLSIDTQAGTRTLTVTGFVRDAQMASSMSSATRFLVADADFAELSADGGGAAEIIVEYRLTDQSLIADFQRAYEADAGLPHNGQAVTYPMIRMINTISDGLVAIALVLVSGVLILIALLNLRFVIRGTLEDDIRHIGAMKALGLSHREISGLYLGKYRVMTLCACLVGGVLAIGAAQLLTRSVATHYAQASITMMSVLAPLLGLVVVYGVVMMVIRTMLRRIKRVDVVTALVHGSTLTPRQARRQAVRQARTARGTELAAFRWGTVNSRLAWLDLRAQRGHWALIPVVFALSAAVMIVPMNLLNTFEDPRFVRYMGAPQRDVRVDVQFGEHLAATQADLVQTMTDDSRLRNVRSYANFRYETPGESSGDAAWETLRVEVGDYSAQTVEFSSGAAPGSGEIALSALNAEKFSADVGDSITIRRDGEETEVTVSGIYQDVTSGGFTAKMSGTQVEGADSYVLYADLSAPTTGATSDESAAAVAAEYNRQFSGVDAKPMGEYVRQTLAYVTDALRTVSAVALIFGLGVAGLITVLFLKLRMTRDQQKMGVLSALGFSNREIGAQIMVKVLITVGAGTVVGAVVANTFGGALVGGLLAVTGIGLTGLTMLIQPLVVYGLYPLILTVAGSAAAALLVARLGRADKTLWLKEV